MNIEQMGGSMWGQVIAWTIYGLGLLAAIWIVVAALFMGTVWVWHKIGGDD